MNESDFELEQYRTLRAEVLRSMEDGNQIMSFGLAAIGIVLSAGIGAKNTLFGLTVFSLLVPTFSGLVLSMWFAAQERTARASYYLTGVESRIKKTLKLEDSHTSWECWLRGSSKDGKVPKHFWYTENSAISMLTVLTIWPLYFSFSTGGNEVGLDIKICVVSIMTIFIVFFLLNLKQRFKQWKRWLSTIYNDEH